MIAIRHIQIFLTLLLFANISFSQDKCRTIKTSCEKNSQSSTCSKVVCEAGMESHQETLKKWVESNNLIGQEINITEVFMEDISNTIPKELKSFKLRILKHNQIVTREYMSNRINFMLDEQNKLKSVSIF